MSELDPPQGSADLATFASEAGKVHVWSPGKRVVIVRWDGRVSEELARKGVVATEKLMGAAPGWFVFGEAWHLDGYDRGSRIAVTQWALKNRPQVEKFSVLVRSKLVAMGVSVINLATGRMATIFSRRLQFETELRGALRQT